MTNNELLFQSSYLKLVTKRQISIIHEKKKTINDEWRWFAYLNAIPHVVDVVVGVAHVLRHDRHPMHETLWRRRISGSGGGDGRQMGVVAVRMGGSSTWSRSRSRRGPCTWRACFGDMRMSRFRRWRPHERCLLQWPITYINYSIKYTCKTFMNCFPIKFNMVWFRVGFTRYVKHRIVWKGAWI